MTESRLPLIVTFALGVLFSTPVAPLATGAQPAGKVWKIGMFHVGLDHVPPHLGGLREGLKALGYEEGKNLHTDWRNLADEDAARAAAREFVQNRVDVIVAFENQTARAAKAATSEIPIVFVAVGAPVTEGFVKSLARPGGNFTGFTGFAEVSGKQIELFKELIPPLRRLLVLTDPDDPVTRQTLPEVSRACAALKVVAVTREAKQGADIERIFNALPPGDVEGLFVASPNLQTKFTSLILRLAAEKRVPVRSHRREWVEQGALFSYAPYYRVVGRDAAGYVDRILKGDKPGDLPVQQPTKFELVINMKTAKTLGLTIPPSVLARANEVIE